MSRVNLSKEEIAAAAIDAPQVEARVRLARYVTQQFAEVGKLLHLSGHIIGPDRKAGASPFGYGSDEVVAISLLFRIASQLISASTDLLQDGRCYAAAALLRQMVEIEYLAWAFETRNPDAERWLRSSGKERRDFFTPAKLRKAAGTRFRSEDYRYHCEFGGHPTPKAEALLANRPSISQLLLSDLLNHAGRVWDHCVGWAHSQNETFILDREADVSMWLLDDLSPPVRPSGNTIWTRNGDEQEQAYGGGDHRRAEAGRGRAQG